VVGPRDSSALLCRTPARREPSHPFTGISSGETEPRTYQDRHGNVSQMRTGAIGRKPAEPPVEPSTPRPPRMSFRSKRGASGTRSS